MTVHTRLPMLIPLNINSDLESTILALMTVRTAAVVQPMYQPTPLRAANTPGKSSHTLRRMTYVLSHYLLFVRINENPLQDLAEGMGGSGGTSFTVPLYCVCQNRTTRYETCYSRQLRHHHAQS